MKTTFFAATLIALTAVSCSKTELSNDSPRMIGFSAETGKMTKAIIDNTTYPDGVAFGVFAYANTENWATTPATITNKVMDNVEITKTAGGTTWKATTGNYYWPNNAATKLSFFAYSPKTATPVPTFTTATDEITITDYAVAAPADVDLMVAKTVDQTYTTQNKGSVSMQFKHVLTQVLFKVKTDKEYANITFTITGLKLTAITSNGTYKQAANAWTAATTPTTLEYVYVTSGTQAITGTATAVGSAKALLPQTLTTDVQKLSITYEIKGTGVATETVTKTMDLHNTTVAVWSPNMKITYNLSIGLKEITFTPSVADWTTNQDVTVP